MKFTKWLTQNDFFAVQNNFRNWYFLQLNEFEPSPTIGLHQEYSTNENRRQECNTRQQWLDHESN